MREWAATGLLNSSPEAHFKGERMLADLRSAGAEHQMQAIGEYYARQAERAHIKAAGFKTRLSHIRSPNILAAAMDRHAVLPIRLYRNNRLKQTLSLFMADVQIQYTGRPHRLSGEPGVSRIEIPPEEFERRRQDLERRESELNGFCANLSLDPVVLSYEEIVSKPETTVEFLCYRLSISATKISWQGQGIPIKQAPEKMADAIVNFEEIEAQYIHSEMSWMLKE